MILGNIEQGTTITVPLPPLRNTTTGAKYTTALTNGEIYISKAGGTPANRNSTTAPVVDTTTGYQLVELDDVDTDTIGHLAIGHSRAESGGEVIYVVEGPATDAVFADDAINARVVADALQLDPAAQAKQEAFFQSFLAATVDGTGPPAATSSAFIIVGAGGDTLSSTDDAYVDGLLVVTDIASGVVREAAGVAAYNGTTKLVTLKRALTAAPGDGEAIQIIPAATMNVLNDLVNAADTLGTGISFYAALRSLLAFHAAKVSGAEGTTPAIRNLADTADVATYTTDANGNRSVATYNPGNA